MKTLKAVNEAMNPKAYFKTDYLKGMAAIEKWQKGFIIYSDCIEYLVELSQIRKETDRKTDAILNGLCNYDI